MRLLFAYTFDPNPRPGETYPEAFGRLVEVVRGWAAEVIGEAVPAFAGELTVTGSNGVAVLTRSVGGDSDLAEVTITAPDAADPTARRTTTVAVARTTHPLGLQVNVRESVALSRFVLRPVWFDIRRPPVIDRLLTAAAGVIGGFPIPTQARRLNAAFVPSFVENELLDERRALPLVVVSPSNATRRPLVDPVVLQASLLGLAGVVELADAATTHKLSGVVGRELSCFGGAVRVYWPGFDLEADRYFHRLYMEPAILGMANDGKPLDQNLFKTLVGAAGFRFAAAPLVEIAREAAARGRQVAVQAEVAKLTVGAEEQSRILTALQTSWDENATLVKRVRELTAELADQKRAWAQYKEAAPDAEPEEPVARPTTFDTVGEVVEFFREYARGTLHFLATAAEAAKQSPYEHPDRVAELLNALHELVEKWHAEGSIGTDWFRALQGYGFEFKPHISQTSATQYAAEYLFLYDGGYHLFENHVTLGSGPPRSCLSVHWFRDDKRKRLAVGWCGKHRTNTKS